MKGLIERIDKRINTEVLRIGAYDGELMTLLSQCKAALSQQEAVEPFGYFICDSQDSSEDFTRFKPDSINDSEQVITLYTSPPSTAQGFDDWIKDNKFTAWEADQEHVVVDVGDLYEFLESQPTAQPAKVPQSVEEFTWANFASYLIDNCEGEAITEERLQHALSDMMTGVRYCPSMPATHRQAELNGVVVNNNLAGDQILLAHPPHTTIPIGTVMIACTHPDISHDCCVVCGKNMMPDRPDFEWLAASQEGI